MSKDYTKLLPALFNDKDLCGYDWVEDFFEEFGAQFVSNSNCTTFIGFINDYEVRLHTVANRLTVEFVGCNPSDELVNKIIDFFSVNGNDENMPFVCVHWKEKRVINFQYYYKD